MLCIGFCEHLYRLYLVSAPDECISKALLSDAVKIFLWFQHRFKLAILAKTVTRINTGHPVLSEHICKSLFKHAQRERERERERERKNKNKNKLFIAQDI